jgi:hypothetical protein
VLFCQTNGNLCFSERKKEREKEKMLVILANKDHVHAFRALGK